MKKKPSVDELQNLYNAQEKRIKALEEIINKNVALPRRENIFNYDTPARALLAFTFPKFEKDYPLLIKHGFLEDTEIGLRWKKSKLSFTA